jgi:hypothetical protein
MFEKITKKQFCDDLTRNTSVLVYGGYTTRNLLSQANFEYIKSVVENLNYSDDDKRTGELKSNRIVFHLNNGEISTLSLSDSGDKTYYAYDNIRIVRTKDKDDDSANYCIYALI